MDTRDVLPEIYDGWTHVYLARGQPQTALAYAEQSVNLARDLGLALEEGKSLRVLGQAQLANDQPEAAVAAFEQSLSILTEQDPYEAARTKAQWGHCLVSGRDAERGIILLQEARATFEVLGARRDLAAVDEILRSNN